MRGWATLLNCGKSTGVLFSLAVLVWLLSPSARAVDTVARPFDDEICDSTADFFLGAENYSQAIRHHLALVREDPNNALAYYHLGFAYGMVGDHERELDDYQKAVELGLSRWDLFLNLGLIYVEAGKLDSARQLFQLAELLAPYRPEVHFNLGVLDERLRMYRNAEQELLFSLALDSDEKEPHNSLGVVYAEKGDYQRAYQEWTELIKHFPDYAPARANLAILKQRKGAEIQGPARLTSGLAAVH